MTTILTRGLGQRPLTTTVIVNNTVLVDVEVETESGDLNADAEVSDGLELQVETTVDEASVAIGDDIDEAATIEIEVDMETC